MITKKVMIGILTTLGLPSCVSYSKAVGEKPTPKRFQNAEAAQIFYEAEFVREEKINDDNDQSISLSIGLQPPISWGSRVTDQKRVNDAFRAADLSQDGFLNLAEARKFAALKRKSP
jgi:hypothetical protein